MEARYIAIYRILGINSLPSNIALPLASLQNPALSATLVEDAEPYFPHIDRTSALISQFAGLFAPNSAGKGTVEERIQGGVGALKSERAKRARAGVFLVFEGQTDAEPNLKELRDVGAFSFCFNAIDTDEIRDRFRFYRKTVQVAVGLSLSADADRRIQKLADVVYLFDVADNRPVYVSTVKFGRGWASVASPLTQGAATEIQTSATKLVADLTMSRSLSLLATSLDQGTDELQGFIAAWSALEIFVNTTFKSVYAAEWLKILQDGAPKSAKPVFDRLNDVMSDKYRLWDKFTIVACVLDPDAAVGDGAEFKRLKDIRDKLLHTFDNPLESLPTLAIQVLLQKYLRLHLK